MMAQTFTVNRQRLCIEGGTFVRKATVSNVNYLYVEDFTIGRGETVTVPVYLHSTVPIWMFQADVVLPEGLTVVSAEFSSDFGSLACAADYTLDCGEVSSGFRLLAFNAAKLRSLPTASKLHLLNLTIKASATLPVDTHTMWMKNFYFVNANTNEGLQGADKLCYITVRPVLVTSVTLNKTEVELTAGQTDTLTATVMPTDATDKSLTWTTSNSAVAQVNNNGMVTAVAPGTATITAKANDGSGKRATCRVTVKPVLVTSVTVTPASVDMQAGDTIKLSTTVLPANATNKTLTWKSSNTSVATVSSMGVVTARSVGSAIITATATDGSGKAGTCQVTVRPTMVSSITLDPNNAQIEVGKTLPIRATVAPSNAANKTLSWRTSNATVATVSNNGVVNALSAGQATITATANDGSGVSAACILTVTPVMVTSLTIPTQCEIEVGATAKLIATVLPENASDNTLAWTSSNPAIVTVNNNGLITAKSEGTAHITAITQDGSDLHAQCTVVVKPKSYSQLSAPDLTVTTRSVGQLLEIPITLTMPQGGNFTNIEMHVTFPDGLQPMADDEGLFGYGGEGIPFRNKTPLVVFTDNFDKAANWPEFIIVGANMTKTPVTTNPCHIYTLQVTAMPNYEVGEREMLIFAKYTTEDDNSFIVGSTVQYAHLCSVHFTQGIPGDVTGDNKLDIDDVNAIVNIILERKTPADYPGDANADGDPFNKVDIDDVNAIINMILSN
ncbi:MAG: Ig-like domain-containing protein [Muribaculaceae bacterium]|nr:Ig-like domain-containing protein [Muribaculaceae bacterium]